MTEDFVDYFGKKIKKMNPSYRSREYKCMNCGNLIEDPTGGPDNRRFCSYRCKQLYLGRDDY